MIVAGDGGKRHHSVDRVAKYIIPQKSVLCLSPNLGSSGCLVIRSGFTGTSAVTLVLVQNVRHSCHAGGFSSKIDHEPSRYSVISPTG